MKNNTSLTMDSPVSGLKGVGPRLEEKLNRLGIYTLLDLLFYLPRNYNDRTKITPIGSLRAGDNVLIEGIIELSQVAFGRRRSLLCHISDGTGSILLRYFYFSKTQQEKLERGRYIRCFGQARTGAKSMEMIHPEYQFIDPDNPDPVENTLTPVYRSTEKLHQKTLRQLTDQVLSIFTSSKQNISELLPSKILEELGLMDINQAIKYVHRPPPETNKQQLISGKHPAQQRLAFEELLAQYLAMQSQRKKIRQLIATPLPPNKKLIEQFIDQLPFELTDAQVSSLQEISRDLTQKIPMLRLLQGDVGAGKTIVAAIAALQTVGAGYQVAVMAPTELLTEQHYTNFTRWFEKLDINIIHLTGNMKVSDRKKILALISENKPAIIIGTHALFQKGVDYPMLRLIIIDEQHRFGVHQRLSLLEKGKNKKIIPHQLIMSATPIPRTLAMTIYADLDFSVINKMPPGRQIINTVAIPSSRRDEIINRIKKACVIGRQVFWVCTLIEESETLQCEAAINTHRYLEMKLPGINVGLIHGKLKSSEKEKVMAKFKSNIINLLVSTTVIEVGVDVPNASLMIIENAERLGLFQLHQLRGRVGRSNIKSDCVMLYQTPLSETARSRIDTLRNTNDGFKIAEKDLELRGPGELIGTRQSGLPELKIADLLRDAKLLPSIHNAAKIILDKYPEIINKLVGRWMPHNIKFVKV